jgi:hypothetical protein
LRIKLISLPILSNFTAIHAINWHPSVHLGCPLINSTAALCLPYRGKSGIDNPPFRIVSNPNFKDIDKCFKYPCGHG